MPISVSGWLSMWLPACERTVSNEPAKRPDAAAASPPAIAVAKEPTAALVISVHVASLLVRMFLPNASSSPKSTV